jgi:hypothetical protein
MLVLHPITMIWSVGAYAGLVGVNVIVGISTGVENGVFVLVIIIGVDDAFVAPMITGVGL